MTSLSREKRNMQSHKIVQKYKTLKDMENGESCAAAFLNKRHENVVPEAYNTADLLSVEVTAQALTDAEALEEIRGDTVEEDDEEETVEDEVLYIFRIKKCSKLLKRFLYI